MGYEPSPDFQQNAKDPLVELKITDSSELWLIQWPLNQPPDFDGQEVRLKLHHDGHLGSFEGSSEATAGGPAATKELPEKQQLPTQNMSCMLGKRGPFEAHEDK